MYSLQVLSVNPKREQGVALITAILIAALAAVVAIGMSNRQFLDTRRAENMLHSDQAYIYALGVETAAAEYLNADQDKTQDLRDEFLDFEVALAGGTLVEGGLVNGRIVQLSGAFPLNNLIKQDGTKNPDYVKALGEYFVNLSDGSADIFTTGQEYLVLDWIDIDSNVDNNGAEESDYLNLDKPYRTPNRALVSTTELRLMMTDFGFKKEAVNLLLKGNEQGQPYVNALPTGAPININVADKLLLKSVLRSADPQLISDATIDKIDEKRSSPEDSNAASIPGQAATEASGFKSVDEMMKIIGDDLADPKDIPKLTALQLEKRFDFSVNTEYFKVESEAIIGNTTVRLNSVLKREPNRVVTLWRSIGTE